MAQFTIYVDAKLADQVKRLSLPISTICQHALRERVIEHETRKAERYKRSREAREQRKAERERAA